MRVLGLLLSIAASPWTILIRGIAAGVSCLLILGVINMQQAVDMATYGIDPAFMPAVLVGALVVGVLVSVIVTMLFHERAAENKVKEGKIASVNDLPYNTKYLMMTVLGLILGVGTGIGIAPFAVDYFTINAGMWTYTIAASIGSGVASAFWISALHTGIRVTLIKAAGYAKDAILGVEEAKEIIQSVNPKK